jgi:hypothetical protein
LLDRLPVLEGQPIRVFWQPRLRAWKGQLHSGDGPGAEVHAASFPRRRELILDAALAADGPELARILTHELFHFVWIRLGNRRRRDWEDLLVIEMAGRARGELGWSSEWRKQRLQAVDWLERKRRWREYCCESFCDTAAWVFGGLDGHEEFTLAARHRRRRRLWFASLPNTLHL